MLETDWTMSLSLLRKLSESKLGDVCLVRYILSYKLPRRCVVYRKTEQFVHKCKEHSRKNRKKQMSRRECSRIDSKDIQDMRRYANYWDDISKMDIEVIFNEIYCSLFERSMSELLEDPLYIYELPEYVRHLTIYNIKPRRAPEGLPSKYYKFHYELRQLINIVKLFVSYVHVSNFSHEDLFYTILGDIRTGHYFGPITTYYIYSMGSRKLRLYEMRGPCSLSLQLELNMLDNLASIENDTRCNHNKLVQVYVLLKESCRYWNNMWSRDEYCEIMINKSMSLMQKNPFYALDRDFKQSK